MNCWPIRIAWWGSLHRNTIYAGDIRKLHLSIFLAWWKKKLLNLELSYWVPSNSADKKFMIFFWFFPENRIWYFMQIVSIGDNLHDMSKPVFGKKKEKIFQYVICWKFYPPYSALTAFRYKIGYFLLIIVILTDGSFWALNYLPRSDNYLTQIYKNY